jgi:predicted metal-binding protein
MAKIAILRSEANARKCPLTSCFKCLAERVEGFSGYADAHPAGVFSIDPNPEETVRLAKILKAKGAEAIHVATCAFAHKGNGGWILGDGLEKDLEPILKRVAAETGLPCVLGTAHLPKGYVPVRF